MSNDQLTVIGFAAFVIAIVFVMSTKAIQPSAPAGKTKKGSKSIDIGKQRLDQQMLKWTGVLITVLISTCAVLYLEVIKLNLLLAN